MNAKIALRWALNEMEMRLDPSIPSVRQAIDAAKSVLEPRRRSAKVIKLPGKTKAERDRKESAANRKVYAAVAARDMECQCGDVATFGPCEGPLHIDHQWGRGKAPTEEKNCRRLCTRHDQMKTENKPSRKAWLVNFAMWALGKRFFGEYDKARAAIALEEAQHPERTTP